MFAETDILLNNRSWFELARGVYLILSTLPWISFDWFWPISNQSERLYIHGFFSTLYVMRLRPVGCTIFVYTSIHSVRMYAEWFNVKNTHIPGTYVRTLCTRAYVFTNRDVPTGTSLLLLCWRHRSHDFHPLTNSNFASTCLDWHPSINPRF